MKAKESNRNRVAYEIFHLTKNISFHIARTRLQNSVDAEKVVQRSLCDAMKLLEYVDLSDRMQVKGLVAILTTQNANSRARKERADNRGEGTTRQIAQGDLLQDEDLYRLVHGIWQLTVRDRAALLLAGLYHMPLREIATLLHTMKNRVELRIQRGLHFLGEHAPSPKRLSVEEGLLPQALASWMEEYLNRLEAISNADPYLFTHDFERRTIHQMITGQGAVKEMLEGRKSMILIFLGAGLGLIFLLFLFSRIFSSQPPKKEEAESAISLPSSEPQEPEFHALVSVPRAYSAPYQSTCLFIDPETYMLYEVPKGGEGKKMYDLSLMVKENGKPVHLGKVDDVIYIAFINGKGGKLSGNPIEFTKTPYWESAWFYNQQEKVDSEWEGVVMNGVKYSFLSQ